MTQRFNQGWELAGALSTWAVSGNARSEKIKQVSATGSPLTAQAGVTSS